MVINSSFIPLLLNHCSAIVATNKPLVLSLFIGGLTGGFSHCVMMCSPFVLAQVDAVSPSRSFQKLLLPYHLGRITTYVLLGAVAGYAFHFLVGFAMFTLISKLMLATAATFFLFALLYKLPLALPRWRLAPANCSAKYLHRLGYLETSWQRYGLGVLLGFIPCGLIFAALMAVASSGSPLIGAVGMFAFGIATTPSLLMVGLVGCGVKARYNRFYRIFTLAAMGINSLILFTLVAK